MRAAARALLFLVAVGLLRGAGAHELGAVQVRARFEAGARYAIEVSVDPSHLPPGARGDDPAAAIASKLELRVDGKRLEPAPGWDAAPSAEIPGAVTVSARGSLPEGSRTLTTRLDWPAGSYYLSCAEAGGEEGAQWVAPGAPSRPCAIGGALEAAAVPKASRTAARYAALGFTHIVPGGTDHILFVLGLCLLARRARPLFAQVSAFTAAHSVSLGLAASGLVALPPRLVEPLIAASIAWVAIENVCTETVGGRRTAVVFAFGLLHGLGFAGVLRELGLPHGRFAVALVSFNVGVEAGQLAVIAAAFGLVGWWSRRRAWYRSRLVVPASIAIAAVGLFWTIERLVA